MNFAKRCLFIILFQFISYQVNTFGQVALNFHNNQSPNYEEIINMYRYLSDTHVNAKLIEAGKTDVGKPLHLFIISEHGSFTPEEIKSKGLITVMINNGIHPGECNGIDASLSFAADILQGNNNDDRYLNNTVILIVPVFNIGGALNRGPYHRANQNGPELHGFRGNAKNLDLNRDFVKLDSKNATSIAKIIHKYDPEIFIDTHSTNGADYPYTLSIIPSHHQQLEKPQSDFLKEIMLPALFENMNNSPYSMTHYVNVFRSGPEEGFQGFYQYPRYLSGYTSAFHILSFTVETHMLKPYPERVLSTKKFIEEIISFSSIHSSKIKAIKAESIQITEEKRNFVIHWQNDTSKYDSIEFSGYTRKTGQSNLTGGKYYYFDANDPWKKQIPFYNYFEPVKTIRTPEYYIVPAAWDNVIERLSIADIEYQIISNDTSLMVEMYHLDSFKTYKEPYNGHYRHYDITVRTDSGKINFYEGDIIIPTNQRANLFLAATLEPHSYDGFFSWNFFDPILSRKEYFSPYLFEGTASEIIENNVALKNAFEKKRANDQDFKSNHYAQLRWIYEHSPYSEATFKRYPVYKYSGIFSN